MPVMMRGPIDCMRVVCVKKQILEDLHRAFSHLNVAGVVVFALLVNYLSDVFEAY